MKRLIGVIGAGAKKAWIPLVLIVVLSFAGLVVNRLHGQFASEDLNANAGAGIEIVQFNPKVVVYDVLGPPGTTARISYFDDVANLHNVEHAPLPWSATVTTTLPTVSANIMVQADGAGVTCRITVDDVVKDERTSDGVNPQTYCLVKSA